MSTRKTKSKLKNRMINVRVTEDVFKHFTEASKAKGLTKSELLTEMILKLNATTRIN
jgi:antitoxin component of RelBE/YafQ-DinJ toxin-antitoxin module